ncbi:MAG: class I SAM-dependent DNA methyltransferase, partial [Anaerolineae bacterium]
MTPQEFVTKWSRIQQKETAVSQSHFNDICALIGHKPPIEHDPTGRDFSFETQAVKPDGGKGFADVFFRGHFIWEYKGPHKDLDRAYRQLQLYRESLHNPPLLITSDIHTIHIHTNFTGYPTVKHTITFDDILTGGGVEKLRWAFTAPQKFTPEKTRAYITKATADTLLAVAEEMKKHREISGEAYNNEQLAHFLVRLLFTLFAEDLGLLPYVLFTIMVRVQGDGYSDLGPALRELFIKMRGGGMFGMWRVRHFDGTLFDDDFVPDIPSDLGESLLRAAEQDWSQVDPSIFGTLFERVIDEGKRAQLGAHYTSESDIMLIVEPVLMEPLRREWQQVRQRVNELLAAGEAQHSTGSNQQSTEDTAVSIQSEFADKISRVRVLDPACGSGNFLYVALRQLLDLQKEVIAYAARKGLPPIVLSVGPEQIYGIEINPYAQELAQVTVWIGYLQWRMENGFTELSDPILRPLRNIKRMDAILAYDEDGNPAEPEWPAADVIIGNPPFLGTKMMRVELGDIYVNEAQSLYRDRLPKDVDLVCYWFEKARAEIAGRGAGRAGLLATNSIRGGSNREVLRRIKETGDIFMAWSDRPWILEGAAVRVSLVGFDNGAEQSRTLDGQRVTRINADLTRAADLTQAHLLLENKNFAFMGDTKQGPFDIDWKTAKPMLDAAENPNGRPNHDVIRLWYNGMDVTRRPRNRWIIDFGVDMPEEEAAQYLAPFAYVKQRVKPARAKNKRSWYREQWWLHYAPRPIMRQAIDPLARYIATPTVAKHRVFVWLTKEILPDHQLIVFARDDDYFFGVLHSRLHEIWSLRMGTSLEDRPRYTPTTTFQTFPFPRPPGQELSEQDDPRVAPIEQWRRRRVRSFQSRTIPASPPLL